VQEYAAAKEALLQTVFFYSAPRTRRVSAAAAALETLAVLLIAQGDAAAAENCLDQSLAVCDITQKERGTRQLNEVERAKAYYLKSMVAKALGKPGVVRCYCRCVQERVRVAPQKRRNKRAGAKGILLKRVHGCAGS
jgi:hypothetical protein